MGNMTDMGNMTWNMSNLIEVMIGNIVGRDDITGNMACNMTGIMTGNMGNMTGNMSDMAGNMTDGDMGDMAGNITDGNMSNMTKR